MGEYKKMRLKKLRIEKERILVFIYVAVLISGIFMSYSKKENATVNVFAMPLSKKVIVIDPGHGGWDPGKVSDSANIYEKDINLKVALKLQSYLEQADCIVLMTRTEDEALAGGKTADLSIRTDLANTSDADIIISIHQNSFTAKNAKGAQVFYYKGSEYSEVLAKSIQAKMKEFLSQSNNRLAKADSSYYMLRKTTVPSVIVECGFLSNAEETNMLMNDTYLEKLSWSIYMGILDYFSAIDEAHS